MLMIRVTLRSKPFEYDAMRSTPIRTNCGTLLLSTYLRDTGQPVDRSSIQKTSSNTARNTRPPACPTPHGQHRGETLALWTMPQRCWSWSRQGARPPRPPTERLINELAAIGHLGRTSGTDRANIQGASHSALAPQGHQWALLPGGPKICSSTLVRSTSAPAAIPARISKSFVRAVP